MAEVNPLDKVITANMDPDGGKKALPRKKAVLAVKSPEPPEPAKIQMEDFLREQAKRNQEKIDETGKYKVVKGRDWEVEKKNELKPEPVDIPLTAIPSTTDQQSYVFHRGDEFAATSRDWNEKGDFTKISDKEKWMKISEEDLDLNAQLAEMKKELDEFGKKYSKVGGEAGAKQGMIRKLNPFSNSEDYDEVKQTLGEWQQKRDEFERAFYHDLALKLSRGEINDQFSKQQEHNFDALMAKEAIELHSRKYDFKKDYSAGKNWISPKIADGYNNFIGKFRKMHPALRIGAGAGIFVVGNIPATIAWRIIGGLAAGKGAHEGLQAAAELWRQRKERKSLQEFEKDMDRRNLSAQERISLRLGRRERQNQGMEQRMAKYARGDYYRKFAGVVLAGLIGSGTMARLIQGTGIGSVIKEKIFGGGAAATQTHEVITAKSSGGSLPSPEPTKFSSETFEQIQKGFEDANPDKHLDDAAKNLSEMYAGGIEPDVKTGGSLQNWAETTPAGEAKVQVPEIVKPQFEDVPVKIKAGGNMWVSIRSNIEANPRAYGLDQTDPQFKAKMNGKITQMLHDFADKKGISYKQLDKVFEGDNFKIKHDVAGNPYLDDFHGKGLGGNVSHGGASAAQETAPSKTSMTVDDAKPKASVAAPDDATRPRAGAVTEHQPTRARGGGKMKFSPEIEEMDRKAAASGAKALESQQYADNLKAQSPLNERQYALAHVQQVRATRTLLELIFRGAGVNEYADVWNKPMKEWSNLFGKEFYISQDVQSNDAIKKTNINFGKVDKLFSILRPYALHGSDKIGECLFRAMKDPANVSKINEWVMTNRR